MVLKRTLSIFLAVLMIGMTLTALPITVNAADVDTAGTSDVAPENIYHVSDSQGMSDAEAKIREKGAGEYVIELDGNIDNGAGISFNGEGVKVTIIGNGHYFHCPAGQNVHAWEGATVILGDGVSELTLKGGITNDNPGVVYIIGSKSTCIMNNLVTIKDNQSSNYFGGGVSVASGTFIMNGGTIENCSIKDGSVCYGGGVGVFNGATFTMNGGTIKDCFVENTYKAHWQRPMTAGGGVFVWRSTFTMNGGTIENCYAEAPDASGGGVAVVTSLEAYYNYYEEGHLDSSFTMNGGTIKNCSSSIGGGALVAGLRYLDLGKLATSANPICSEPDNTGVYLNRGTMTNNESSVGGAIFLNYVRPNAIIENMVIDSNTADEGGAIDVFHRWTHAQINNCTITNNHAEGSGGAIMLNTNIESNGTHIKNTTITGNTSGGIGAGVYYDANSKLTISGANTIQNNTYNGSLNNLNIYSKDYPVYVDGALTGSQIGLSDPKLWDDGLEDEAGEAVSEDYLTSGYKNYNTANPSAFFTSDHDTWFADFSDVNDNEVRLVRKKPEYHINNEDIDDKYNNNDIFTSYVEAATKEVKVGETINEFYTVPEVVPTATNSCPYIFKGWYYDRENDNDSRPVQFGTDKYAKDIYAHWIKVDNVTKDADDPTMFQDGDEDTYGGFDLAGVQIRKEMRDYNFDDKPKMPGGMRFITSLNMDVVNEINKIKPNNIEYGYVAATHKGWIDYHCDGVKHGSDEKLKYVSTTANGINTSEGATNENYFGFAKNVNCTSKVTNSKNGVVRRDHQIFDKYLLYSLVITYEEKGSDKGKDVLARPYIRYTDANGLERVAYSEYTGTNVLGGCYTNYNRVADMAGN